STDGASSARARMSVRGPGCGRRFFDADRLHLVAPCVPDGTGCLHQALIAQGESMYSIWKALFGRRVPEVISAVLRDGLTYLGSEALLDLYTAIRKLERRRAEGILIEAGCARGGSALVLASAKARTRPFFIYD